MKLLLVLFSFVVFLTSWPGQKPPTRLSVFTAVEVLDEVNALRAEGCKCPGGRYFKPAAPLQWNEQLEKAAQDHADDMNLNRYFSHDSRDGTRFSRRIEQAGYDWKVVGENIAMGYPTARAVVEAWRKSRDHCPNLMNPEFRDMGVGRAGPYWVQDLATRLEE